MRRLASRAAFVVTTLAAASAFATPSRWAIARSPELQRDESARAAAEVELLAHRHEKKSPFEDPILRVESHAPRAAQILERSGAWSSDDWYLRVLLARAHHESQHWKEAAAAFESVIEDKRTPAVFRADALADVAIAYARLDRQDDEIEAYETSLALEPHPSSRATMLANQAEAFMVKGDVSRAISGYRASLEALTSYDAPFLAPTTLWSLGVALDRSGDLDAGLESIGRARSYDPNDVRIKGPGWFFVPPYDEAYYDALGEWHRARRTVATTEDRLESYERAVIAWKQYLGRAPEAGPYVPVARARLKMAEKEFIDLSKRAQTPTPVDPRLPAEGKP